MRLLRYAVFRAPPREGESPQVLFSSPQLSLAVRDFERRVKTAEPDLARQRLLVVADDPGAFHEVRLTYEDHLDALAGGPSLHALAKERAAAAGDTLYVPDDEDDG
jgi:hypothetical protein